MNKSLLVSLSAALISLRLTGGAMAAYTDVDIDRIEILVSSGSWVELRSFLLANPSLLTGDDAFTEQLRLFLENTDSLYTALTFDPSLFPNTAFALREPFGPPLPSQLPPEPRIAAILPTAPSAPADPGTAAPSPRVSRADANTQPVPSAAPANSGSIY